MAQRADLGATVPRRRASSLAVYWAALLAGGCTGIIDYPDAEESEAPRQTDFPSGADTLPVASGAGDTQPAQDMEAVTQQAPADNGDGATPDGAALYQAQCRLCHGEAGIGTDIAPEIQHPPPEFYRWVVRNGLEGAFDSAMPSFTEASLAQTELEAILDYLGGLPQADTDAGLYLDYCANCHAADARGGVAKKHIAGKNEFVEVVRKGKGGNDFAARTRYMPRWQEDELGSDLVSRIETYVGELPE